MHFAPAQPWQPKLPARSAVLLCGLIFAAAGVARAAPGAEEVGAWGAPESLKFEGCERFSRDELLPALRRDLNVQLASAPSAPLEAYLTTVREAVQSGYRHAGYAAAKVTVEKAGQAAVVVKVTEGPRQHCGPVRVIGARTLPADALVAKLTAERAAGLFPLDFSLKGGAFRVAVDLKARQRTVRPAWPVGEPVRSDKAAVEELREAVLRSGAELGYFDAWFDVKALPAEPSALEITIRNEGPRATLDGVDVLGTRKNTPEAVVAYLGLRVGEPLDLGALRDVQQRLWDSGRFMSHVVYAQPRRLDPSRIGLRIELRELEEAPPLNQPLSDVEQAMLRSRKWALDSIDRGDDFVLGGTPGAGRATLAFGQATGAAFRFEASPPHRPVDVGLFMTASVVGVAAPRDRGLFATGRLPAHLSQGFLLALDPEGGDKPLNFGLDWGFSTRQRPDDPPMTLDAVLAPAAFLKLAHMPGCAYDLRDCVLTVRGPKNTEAAIEAATGRLVRLRLDDWEVSVKRGVVDEMVAAMGAGADNKYEAAAPLGSLARFLVTQACREPALAPDLTPARRGAAAEAAAKLLRPEALVPLERITATLRPMFGDPAFEVPRPAKTFTAADWAAPTLPVVDELFPRGSWPWTLARLAPLAAAGEFRGATEEVARLMASDRVGALGYLSAAELLARVNPAIAPPFARRGLERLGPEWLDADVDQLLGEGLVPAEVLGNVVANFRTLDEAEVDALCAAVPADARPFLRAFAGASRQRPAGPPRELLRAALRKAWEAGLRDKAEARLRALQAPGPGGR